MEDSYCYKFPRPAVTTDCVIFGFDGKELNVLLIQRGIDPFKGRWAFPGGFLKENESAEECALRELREETSLTSVKYMEQFHTYSELGRDPRGHVISIAFYAFINISDVKGGDDAARADWFPVKDLPKLAFDHDRILRDALKHLRERIHFNPVGYNLLPEEFSMTQLQNLYEAILGVRFDRRNFSKKILHLDILAPHRKSDTKSTSRHLCLYSFRKDRYDTFKETGFNLEF